MSEENGGSPQPTDKQRYEIALHRMQSGVAFLLPRDPDETSPKHLRVGVNSAMVEHAALVRLLIAKGILTEEEFFRGLADAMEEEATRYEQRLQQEYGANIKLG